MLFFKEHNQITNQDWYSLYKNNWRDHFNWEDVGWSVDGPFYEPGIGFVYEFNGVIVPASDVNIGILMSDSVLNANTEHIISSHEITIEKKQVKITMSSEDDLFFLDKIKREISSSTMQNNLAKSLNPTIEDWEIIEKIAQRTFVPESEESRIKGAGGGDDND